MRNILTACTLHERTVDLRNLLRVIDTTCTVGTINSSSPGSLPDRTWEPEESLFCRSFKDNVSSRVLGTAATCSQQQSSVYPGSFSLAKSGAIAKV